MANVTVTNNMARLFRVGSLALVPGENTVDAKAWDAVKDLKPVKARLERDPKLRMRPLEVTGEEKPEPKGKGKETSQPAGGQPGAGQQPAGGQGDAK